MANIEIWYDGKSKPMVTPDPTVALQDELITWSVFSQDFRINKVKIEFGKVDLFFPAADGARPECEKWLARTKIAGMSFDRCGVFWGMTPKSGELNESYKYTLYAYDEDGNEFVDLRLDPRILTVRRP